MNESVIKKIEIEKLADIKSILERRKSDWSELFSVGELKYCGSSFRSLGARYLIKKQILDFINQTLKLANNNFLEIEVVNNSFKKPEIRLYGNLKHCTGLMKIRDIYISISHSRNWITAMTLFCY